MEYNQVDCNIENRVFLTLGIGGVRLKVVGVALVAAGEIPPTPFTKGGPRKSPFRKGGFRGISRCHPGYIQKSDGHPNRFPYTYDFPGDFTYVYGDEPK